MKTVDYKHTPSGKFGKGNSGKPKGATHKKTSNLRNEIRDLIGDNIEQFREDLKVLEPEKRAALFIRMLDFAVPRLRSIEEKVSVDSLTSEQAEELINKIIQDGQ